MFHSYFRPFWKDVYSKISLIINFKTDVKIFYFTMSNFFKGTSIEQDTYFKNKYKKELNDLNCPEIYNE